MELTTTQIGMPLDDFIRLYETEGPFELINGQRIPKQPNVAGHGEVIELLYLAIHAIVSAGGVGKIIREMPFVLSFTSSWVTGSRLPDLMYYTADRLNDYKAAIPDWKAKPYILVPDLVIEGVSSTDNWSELDEKIDQYLLDGVQVVWVIDPQKQGVSIHTLTSRTPFTKQQTHLNPGDLLKGGDSIPGFEIPVIDIFA